MARLSAVLRSVQGQGLAYWCTGCGHAHIIYYGDGPGPRWGWNGDELKPTFTPSVKTTIPAHTWENDDGTKEHFPERVMCHHHVVDGVIQYLDDCTEHTLRGFYPLQEIPPGYGLPE